MPAPMMTWVEYARLDPAWPYILKLDVPPGGLLYFGAAHTYDPADPQVDRVEKLWQAFEPDIAFTEGSPRRFDSRDEAVRRGGEPGLVRFLAARDDVPTTSFEPTRAEELAALAGRFSPVQLKLFYILRDISQFAARNGPADVSKEIERLLAIYADTPGLSGSPRTLAEFEAVYLDAFPGHRSYDSIPPTWFDPVEHVTFLNEISRASSDYRDQQIVDRLVHHVNSGRRVFAVIGGSHVVMQEPVLRSRLKP